ncbi:hypothetical protein TSOC_008160 [Tetrabaena socialis]|uniref:High light inducible protein n=1 Tax=Tetrabaena socialis TaxID=47790 RepID=A0A2J7ZZ75_9CHLO|nr:hypothetical protein TSOC_008160 [Tetrabaena socialis]|eukprot:PNH05565.1 hypothetical protein TSOC_008160 [Tetrabaena socialis]
MSGALAFRACPLAGPTIGRRQGSLTRQAFSRSSRASVRPMAMAKAPAGVSMPPKQPDGTPPQNGFVEFAEKMNSRAAMIGFFALLAVEGIFGKGLLELLGMTTGNGLGFEL